MSTRSIPFRATNPAGRAPSTAEGGRPAPSPFGFLSMRDTPWSRFLRTLFRNPRRPHRPFPPRVEALEGRDVPAPLSVLSQQFAGGPGDQTGTAVAVVPGPVSAVYVTGNSDANGGEG